MNFNLIIAQQYHAVSWRPEICRNTIDAPFQLQGDLMVQAPHARITDAPPIAKNGAMHMAREQVSDAGR